MSLTVGELRAKMAEDKSLKASLAPKLRAMGLGGAPKGKRVPLSALRRQGLLVTEALSLLPDARLLRHLAADVAEALLPAFEREHPGDPTVRVLVDAARRLADGEMSVDEADALGEAAHARVQGQSASDTALTAAGFAVRRGRGDAVTDAAVAAGFVHAAAMMAGLGSTDQTWDLLLRYGSGVQA